MMLVLRRTRGQGVVIGERIFLTVAAIQEESIRLKLEVPDDVPVHIPQEVLDQSDIDFPGEEVDRPEGAPHPTSITLRKRDIITFCDVVSVQLIENGQKDIRLAIQSSNDYPVWRSEFWAEERRDETRYD